MSDIYTIVRNINYSLQENVLYPLVSYYKNFTFANYEKKESDDERQFLEELDIVILPPFGRGNYSDKSTQTESSIQAELEIRGDKSTQTESLIQAELEIRGDKYKLGIRDDVVHGSAPYFTEEICVVLDDDKIDMESASLLYQIHIAQKIAISGNFNRKINLSRNALIRCIEITGQTFRLENVELGSNDRTGLTITWKKLEL